MKNFLELSSVHYYSNLDEFNNFLPGDVLGSIDFCLVKNTFEPEPDFLLMNPPIKS
jgi:hypothetical protein